MTVDIFLNLGNTIVGESQDAAQGPLGDMDVTSYRYSARRAGLAGAGKAAFSDIEITKYVDSASIGIMHALARGTHIAQARLLHRRAGHGQQKMIELFFREVLVTQCRPIGISGNGRMLESIKLNFKEISFEYFRQDKTGAVASTGIFSWDIAGNNAN